MLITPYEEMLAESADLVLISIGNYSQLKNAITQEYEDKTIKELKSCGFFVRRILVSATTILNTNKQGLNRYVYYLVFNGNKACHRVQNPGKLNGLDPCLDVGCYTLNL